MPDYATKDPSNLLLGQADGTFVEGAEAAGIVELRPRPRCRRRRPQPRRAARPRRGEPPRRTSACGATSGRATPSDPAAMGDWLARRLEQPAPNRDAIGSWIEVRTGDRTTEREVTVGGGHASGELGWIHFGLGDADGRGPRSWPDGEIGPWMAVDRGPVRRRSSAARRRRRGTVDPPEPDDGRDANGAARRDRPARLRHARRDAGDPRRPLRRAPGAAARACGRARLRPPRRVRRPRAQREPRLPHRLRPALRGGDRRRRTGRRADDPGRQRVLRDGWSGATDDAPAPVPGPQPAQASRATVAAARRDPRRRGHRA